MVVETWYVVCVSCIWCICSSCCCCRAPWISRNARQPTICSYLTLRCYLFKSVPWTLDMVYVVYIRHSSLCRCNFVRKNRKRVQIQQRRIWGCAHSVPTIQAFTHPNLFSGHWDMIYCMYECIDVFAMEIPVWPQLNSRKLYASHMWLIPNTQADIHFKCVHGLLRNGILVVYNVLVYM